MYVIARYMQTFLLLQPYDEGLLVEPLHGVAGGVLPTIAEPRGAIVQLNQDLLIRREATKLSRASGRKGLPACRAIWTNRCSEMPRTRRSSQRLHICSTS